jgi:type I restriction enzyme R subunit
MYEEQIEKEALEILEKLGYEILFGPSIAPDGEAPEREDFSQVILKKRLEKAIKKLIKIYQKPVS